MYKFDNFIRTHVSHLISCDKIVYADRITGSQVCITETCAWSSFLPKKTFVSIFAFQHVNVISFFFFHLISGCTFLGLAQFCMGPAVNILDDAIEMTVYVVFVLSPIDSSN
jgi:hypothetical protein